MSKVPDFLYRTNKTPEKIRIHNYICETFIPAFTPVFSSAAWSNFKLFGRGYLFVPIMAGKTAEDGFGISYFSKGSELYEAARQSEIKSGQQLENRQFYIDVDEYNPKHEFVIVVGWSQMSDKATEHFFRCTPDVPPYLVRMKY